jgi:hypothetical protein
MMKWLLVFVWMAPGVGLDVTTERFETKAECEATAVILTEWASARLIPMQSKYWRCFESDLSELEQTGA